MKLKGRIVKAALVRKIVLTSSSSQNVEKSFKKFTDEFRSLLKDIAHDDPSLREHGRFKRASHLAELWGKLVHDVEGMDRTILDNEP